MRRDESARIREVVNAEIAKRAELVNFHGITADNIETFLVAPFQVPVEHVRGGQYVLVVAAASLSAALSSM